jgi:hypothetical protein
MPSPVVSYALRCGIAVSAALWIGKAPGLVSSHSTWILITVLMLVQPTTGASLLKAVLRGVGTLLAAVGELARRIEAALGEIAAVLIASRAPTPFSDDLDASLCRAGS